MPSALARDHLSAARVFTYDFQLGRSTTGNTDNEGRLVHVGGGEEFNGASSLGLKYVSKLLSLFLFFFIQDEEADGA